MLNHTKIQSGHSVILASSFDQTRHSVPKPENSHFSDGPLIILSLQLLLIRVGVNSAPELDFLANSKSNSGIGIELELALLSPGGIGIAII